MAATPDKNTVEQTKRPRKEVFERDSTKRRTTISISAQADEDIAELMRRTRHPIPGNIIGDAVRLMRVFPAEFVTFMFSELDKGEDQVVAACRDMMRACYELQAKHDSHPR